MRVFFDPARTGVMYPAVMDCVAGYVRGLSSYWKMFTASKGHNISALLPSPTTFSDGEVLVKVKVGSHLDGVGVLLRAQTTLYSNTLHYGYYITIRNEYWNQCAPRVYYVDADGYHTLASGSRQSGTTWWLRVRMQGSSILVKAWLNGNSEPSSWTFNITNSAYSAGHLGVSKPGSIFGNSYYENTVDYVYPFGVDFSTNFSPPTAANFASIQGQVLHQGSPVEGAKVFAVREGWNSSRAIRGIDLASATTDANGNYTISLNVSGATFNVFAEYKIGDVWYNTVVKPGVTV